MLILQLLLALVPLGALVIEFIYERERPRHRRWRVLIPFAAVATALTFWLTIGQEATASRDAGSLAQLRSDEQKWRDTTGERISKIGGQLGDPDAAKEYVEGVAKLNHLLVAQRTGNSVDNFFSTRSEREKLRHDVATTDARLLNLHLMRLQPIYDLIASQFDAWVEGVQKKGIKLDLDKTEFAAVRIGRSQTSGLARGIKFENGDQLTLEPVPAQIDHGRLIEDLNVAIRYQSTSVGRTTAWFFRGSEDGYLVSNQNPGRFGFPGYNGKERDPKTDKGLIDAISVSLDEVMASIIDEATARK